MAWSFKNSEADIGGPSEDHFFEGLITRMYAKPFRALTPNPLVCCGVETAFSKDLKAHFLGDEFGERISSSRTGPSETKKTGLPNRFFDSPLRHRYTG